MHRIARWGRTPLTIILALITALVVGGYWSFVGAQSSAPQQNAPNAPVAQNAPALPPVLLTTDPAENTAWGGDPVTLTFDQALDPRAADYVTVSPALPGEVSVQAAQLVFTPAAPPAPGERYTLRVDGAAPAANGLPLGNPVEIVLTGATPLAVTATQPSADGAEIDTTAQIIVIFNRPVVPLVGADDQADLPNPLTIDPAVEGEGRWLSTSVYAFQPALALAGATDYTVTVADLTAVDGSTLVEPYTFSFSTAAPLVLDSQPNGTLIRPDTPITVNFSQPMDPASTTAAFSLVNQATNAAVTGDLTWDEAKITLVFTPSAALEFGATYRIAISDAAQPASRQGTLRTAYSRVFTVVPLPRVETVSPVAGAQEVSPEASVVVRFSAPVSPTLLLQNIQVTPLLTTTQVYSYYSEYMSELQLSWFKEPNTRYTVTLAAAIGDEYGNVLGEDYVLTFTTGDHPPFARLEVEPFTHFTAFSDTRLSVLYRNIGDLEVELYRLPDSELFLLTGVNQWQTWENYQVPNPAANRVWSRSYEVPEERNVAIRQIITLTDELDNDLAPGVYFVDINQPTPPEATVNALNDRSQALVVISNLNLIFKKSDGGDSLVWLTDLRTGQPVGGVPVRFYRSGAQIAEGVTDEAGILRLPVPPDPEMGWSSIIAIAGQPGAADFAVVSSEWTNGIAIWDFNLFGGWTLDALMSHFYTDRPIYRPGQTVYWKGIVRQLINDEYRIPPADLRIQVALRDPMGNSLLEQSLPLSELGTVNGEVTLSPEAITGGYYLEVQLPLGNDRIGYAGTSFVVASYRKPEFEISVTPAQDSYQQGDTVQVTVQANYFSGGPMGNAPVTWRLISEPYNFFWNNGPADRFFSFQPFDPDQVIFDPYGGSVYLGLIREGSGVTQPDGSFVIELPADLSDAPQSQRWVFDVTVQSPTNQFVSGNAAVPVHKTAYYAGVSPREYVGQVDAPTTVDVVAVDPDGATVAGVDLEIVIYDYQWNSVYARNPDGIFRWETSITRTPIYTTTVTTDSDGYAAVEWTPTVGGQYQVTVQGTDANGQRTSAATFLWVSARDDSAFVAWPRGNNDRIELVADKRLYAPGDTARILVPSPFVGPVQALLTIERAGIVSAQVITLQGNSEFIELPITTDHIPNIFVSVVIAKGMDETNPTPAQRMGYVQLNVDARAKELSMDVTTSLDVAGVEQVTPGATVAYTLTVTDQDGNPVPDAEISAAIVDRAVLALAYEPAQDLIDVFYIQRPLGIMTAALLTINRDRLSAQLSEGAKGGGGGGGGPDMDLRTEFPDIAFWRANLTTDADGIATFTVTLPDNLTTWRLAAKAITADTRVGNTLHDVVATKDLQVRPILPRFFTAGDIAEIGAVVLNTTDQAWTDGELSITLDGAAFTRSGPTTIPLDLDAAGQVRAAWEIVVPPTSSVVTVTFAATAGSGPETRTDGVQLVIPVVQYLARATVATSGQVSPEGLTEAIRVPAQATDDGELLVTLEPSLAGGLVAGLDYLADYPYECTEQTVSSFLPNLFTARALAQLDIQDPALTANLDASVNRAVQRLVSRQNQDGGWGYWPGERSSVFITAYALWGLANADRDGYAVPARTLTTAGEYIERAFVAPDRVTSTWQLNELAFMLYVLSELDMGDPGRASTLYDVRERLGHYGKAYLALALANAQDAPQDDPRIATLLDDLYGAAQVTGATAWWQEDSIDYRTLNTDTRSTAIVLAAFVRLDPEQPILPQAVRWLMQTRQQGRWSNTQENAWAIIALTDWLRLTGELQASYDWAVTLNQNELGSGQVTPANVTTPITLRAQVADLLRDDANALRFSRSTGQGRLYYTTYLRTSQDAATVGALDRGVVVDRTFQVSEDGRAVPAGSVQVGDVVSVTVTIIAPTDLFHLLVEVPIPAGTEPLDPNLLTTSDQFSDPMLMAEDGESTGPTWWRDWVPSYTDMRDDKVALFATFLSAGTYEYTFNVQATVPGEYRVLPAYAEQMYFTEVWGRSAGSTLTITGE